ncbi:MAG: hypothetical protein OXU23_05670 [Candidatus Poribacteria bacterium]|nr:hypothetical protein [Candidatus Poribacteria bacterium]
MSKASERLRRRREAKKQLIEINKNRNNVLVIHYSCESFYNRVDRTSPRITSIAVRNLATGQTESFSIHQIAERDKKLSIESINSHYNELEKKMLKEFYDHAEKHKNDTWLHWNMRDINYGFAALEHRYKVLGGKPFEIHESCRCDLSLLLYRLYGHDYIEHPRLKNLAEKNSLTHPHFLKGPDEAKAFKNSEYVKLHQSTLCKVGIISYIADWAVDTTLKTNAKLTGIYGNYFVFVMEKIKENWGFVLLSIIGAVASTTSWLRGC